MTFYITTFTMAALVQTAITAVQGALLAVILATWMWTWWWNRYVVTYRPEPNYDAATEALTTGVIRHFNEGLGLEAHRARIAREVVDAAFAGGDETTGEIEVVSHYGLTYEKYLADMVPRQQ